MQGCVGKMILVKYDEKDDDNRDDIDDTRNDNNNVETLEI